MTDYLYTAGQLRRHARVIERPGFTVPPTLPFLLREAADLLEQAEKEAQLRAKREMKEANMPDSDAVRHALEKQIPKKPLHIHKNFYCPVCKEDGWIVWDDAEPNEFDTYCGMCGQKIDWSEQQ